MTARALLLPASLFALALSSHAQEFALTSPDGVGPIMMQTRMEVIGGVATFTASARNESAYAIRRAEFCVYPLKQKGQCLATTAPLNGPWKPGETVHWSAEFDYIGHGLPRHTLGISALDAISPPAVQIFQQPTPVQAPAQSGQPARGDYTNLHAVSRTKDNVYEGVTIPEGYTPGFDAAPGGSLHQPTTGERARAALAQGSSKYVTSRVTVLTDQCSKMAINTDATLACTGRDCTLRFDTQACKVIDVQVQPKR